MLGVTPTNAEVVLVDRPEDECIFVALFLGLGGVMLSRVMRFGLVERGGPGDVGDSALVQHKMSSQLDNEMII